MEAAVRGRRQEYQARYAAVHQGAPCPTVLLLPSISLICVICGCKLRQCTQVNTSSNRERSKRTSTVASQPHLVKNTGDRPIQVGSHYHFFEVNRALVFDRDIARGMRLNIPAGTAVRFEPGEEKEVTLVAIGGARRVFGHNGLVNGRLDDAS